MVSYVEQNFGTWTVPGGMGVARRRRWSSGSRPGGSTCAPASTATRPRCWRRTASRACAPTTGDVPADVVVVAVDPRRLPALAPHVRRTMPAIPPVVAHLGIIGDVPDLPHEVVLHGDPLLVLRTNGTAPEGAHAWTVLGRGRIAEDLVTALSRHGIDVRRQVEVRVDRSPREQVEAWRGSPYGVLWQGRRTARPAARHRSPGAGRLLRRRAHRRPGPGCRGWGCPRRWSPQAVGPGVSPGLRRRQCCTPTCRRRESDAPAPRRSPASPWTGSACRSAGPARRRRAASSQSSVAIAMPDPAHLGRVV